MVPIMGGVSESATALAAELVRLWQDTVAALGGAGKSAAAAAVEHDMVQRGTAWVRHVQPFLLDLAAVGQGPESGTAADVRCWAAGCQRLLRFTASQHLPSLTQHVIGVMMAHAAAHNVQIVNSAEPGAAPPVAAGNRASSANAAPSEAACDAGISAGTFAASPAVSAASKLAQIAARATAQKKAEQKDPQTQSATNSSLSALLPALRAALRGFPAQAPSVSGHTASVGQQPHAALHMPDPEPMTEPHYLATKSAWLLDNFDLQVGLPLRLATPMAITLMSVLSGRPSLMYTWAMHVSLSCSVR